MGPRKGGGGRGSEIGCLPGPQTANSGGAYQARHRTPNFRARTVGAYTADPAALLTPYLGRGWSCLTPFFPLLLASFSLTCPALLASSHPQAEQTCFLSASTPTSSPTYDENPPEGRERRQRAKTMRIEILGPVKKKTRGDRDKNEEYLGLCGYH